jgi:hypothetical protein
MEYKKKLEELENLTKELKESINKAQNWEERITVTENHASDQDRKWRKKNLRISNLASIEPGEATEITVAKMIMVHKLWSEERTLKNILDEIEYAQRTGRDLTNRPRQILVRFKKEEIKNLIAINSKIKETARNMSPIYVQDDLTPQDMETKALSREYMKEAHEKGLQPRFIDGIVKIRQKDGKRRTVSKEEIEKFNRSEWKCINEEGKLEMREDRLRAHMEMRQKLENGPPLRGTYRNAILIGLEPQNEEHRLLEGGMEVRERRQETYAQKEEMGREHRGLTTYAQYQGDTANLVTPKPKTQPTIMGKI